MSEITILIVLRPFIVVVYKMDTKSPELIILQSHLSLYNIDRPVLNLHFMIFILKTYLFFLVEHLFSFCY